MTGRWRGPANACRFVCLVALFAGVLAPAVARLAPGLGWLAPGLGWLAAPAAAQRADLIEGIRVTGNQRIEYQTVVSYMKVVIGDPFDPIRIDESLKSLFATGLFADVSMAREANTLIVRLVENPQINEISFEGNRKVDDDVLAGEVQLRARTVYTRTKVQQDVSRLLDIYRRSGRFAVSIEPKAITLPQNRIDLVFEVNEGELTGIQRILFIGNQRFSDATLREVILTRQTRWWRILSASDTYDPDRLSFDRELLRRYYLTEGYADFRVVNALAELTPDRENFFITFTVEEGERYQMGEVSIDNRLVDLDEELIVDSISTETGDWYDAAGLEESVQQITDAVSGVGYAFVEVTPVVERDRDNLTVDVTYQIDEGERVYVERINIVGNVRTLDEIIRRNMRLAEGDAFNSAKLRRSRELIRGLGFFSEVTIDSDSGDAPDQTIVTIGVAEQATGEISFGAGFSTAEGATGSVGIRERNFLGRGQDVGVAFTLSERTQNLELTFTEPYFLNRDVAAGIDAFLVTRNFNESSFEQDVLGGSLRTSFSLADRLRQTWRYTIQSEEIIADAGAAFSIVEQAGSTLTSILGQTLSYDRVDDRRNPSDGYFVRWNIDLAGLGGDREWLRNRLEAGVYVPFWDDWVFSVVGDGGYIYSFTNQNILINDRFFLGSNDFRGFDRSGIGPRDSITDDSLGGNVLYKGTAEVLFPIGLPEEFGIKGRAFVIAGSLFGIDTASTTVLDISSLRASGGIGLSWSSPFGPVRIDLALPFLSESFDRDELLSFGFGSFF